VHPSPRAGMRDTANSILSSLPSPKNEGFPEIAAAREFISVANVIYRYLDFSDLHNGFARVKRKDCGHEYLLAFPCKCRCFQSVIFNAFLTSVLRTCRVCRVKRMTCRLKSDGGSSVVRPCSWREV
jgi:hypothetical protein